MSVEEVTDYAAKYLFSHKETGQKDAFILM